MLNILLNLAVCGACLYWLHLWTAPGPRRLVLPIVLAYLFAAAVVLVLSLIVQAGYLDGVHYLLVGGAFLLLFWGWSTVVLVRRNRRDGTPQRLLGDLAQTSILLIVPPLLWLWIGSMSLKIGG